ncbi:uncharacterized protein [Spinacia oleracea]|uniref:Legume lectin domain-containing protein n=1 Tax=Spinacia oleracea TaxID=3562 RepID=A0ABM3R1I7_SPIOL|nr:uncharacterized protein LOC130464105 [Spinacia oleracea]
MAWKEEGEERETLTWLPDLLQPDLQPHSFTGYPDSRRLSFTNPRSLDVFSEDSLVTPHLCFDNLVGEISPALWVWDDFVDELPVAGQNGELLGETYISFNKQTGLTKWSRFSLVFQYLDK